MKTKPLRSFERAFENMKRKQLRIGEVAAVAGLNPATIWKWKSGKSHPTAEPVARFVAAVRAMKRWTVYEILLPNGKSYIGCTHNLDVRTDAHWCSAMALIKDEYCSNIPFYTALRNAGRENMVVKVLSVHESRAEGLAVEKAVIQSRAPESLYNVQGCRRFPLDDMIGERHLANTPVPFPTFEPEQAASLAPSDDAAAQA